MSERAYVHQALLGDGSLILSIDERLRGLAAQWMPSLPETRATAHAPSASIRVDAGTAGQHPEDGPHSISLGHVRAWVNSAAGNARLRSEDASISAEVDLNKRVAEVSVDETNASIADVTSALTIITAFLLVRAGMTPIHAAGVVHPDSGRAWLLAGDSHSGKSTTTANLVRAGWSYLSDDYVVLGLRDDGEVTVEGWPDDFHLDEGFHAGESTGIRGTLRESALRPGSRVSSSLLHGVLFPRVSPGEPTLLSGVAPVVTLERLIRQSPWLMADSASAAKVLALLGNAASGWNGELRLGSDTFANPSLLDTLVREFAARSS